MRKLSLIFIGLWLCVQAFAIDNPHGKGLKIDCSSCHGTDGWAFVNTGKFNHNTTGFVLDGQHQFQDCKSCHPTLVFNEAQSTCISCHTDMHNNTVGSNCTRCHNTSMWLINNTTEMHQLSRFPLLGAHRKADCAACHTAASKLEFQPLGTECIDCHRQDYWSTTSPNHSASGFSTNCIECHKIEATEWSSSGFNHDFFPLTQGHAISNCTTCHTNGISTSPSPDCYSCHQSNFENALNPNHAQNNFSTNCIECHTTAPGWKPAKFDNHDAVAFPIYSGKHKGEWNSCTDCHKNPNTYSEFTCTDCHEHNQSKMDKEHREVSGYSYNSTACFACHPQGNKATAFNHDATGFPLKGAHLSNTCEDCHKSGFTALSTECNSCHHENFLQTTNPNHQELQLSNNCASCHDESGWSPSNFNHELSTGFALSGGHAGKNCSDCHKGNVSQANSDCYGCHQANYNSAANHLAQSYPTNCLLCHTTLNWEQHDFDHNNTNFPLTGAHVSVDCATCHTNGYAGTSSRCDACHSDQYAQAQNPDHNAAGISKDCENCHQTNAWQPSIFDHASSTGFALTGGHAGHQCAVCHKGTTSGNSSDCISCHQANYNNAKDHVALNFPTNCLQCHNTNSWSEYQFDHNSTNFPLTGAHISVDCATCHTNGYAGTSSRCDACHSDQYAQAQNPDHNAAGISKDCENCHQTNAWQPSIFDHASTTGFALTGGHAGHQCAVCHKGTTSGNSSDCISCHQANYNNAKDHVALNFPTNCLLCHNTNSWADNQFDHNNTNFPLTGAHVGTECSQCHSNGYSGTSTECASCHQSNYNNATNPSHVSLGLSTDCASCHSTQPGWQPAKFPNHNNYYALNGAHASIADNCTQCHAGNYNNTPNTCYGCHQSDYNKTTNPNHASAGFSTDCRTCHSETAWQPATFDHDTQYFPIYSGKHRGKWNSCTECHTNSANYAVFSCLNCHEHSQAKMDEEHSGVNGYVYASTSCLSCHPNGDKKDD